MTVPPLVGRERELGVLDGLVDGVGERGGALVVRGEAGIGKSALLAAASTRATEHGITVLTTTGVQTEAHLPFAGLHQLLRAIIAGAEGLPARQRDALLAAFGMADAAAPDRFLITLAALELLADTAARSPLLLVVEDAQWLDRPSGDVLAFVARRLVSEPIALLAAVREGYASVLGEAGLPELRLEGLEAAAAGALLAAHAPALAPRVRERLLGEAAGNPLALMELRVALGSDQLRARLLLAYGAWLRRQRRVAESRAPLRAAREAFDALGAVPWGERARQELRAAGEASHHRTPRAWDRLSPQELQIARLAADGLSNREIGQQLYLSHRTVSSHLYRVFPKLGISSRSQLRTVLDSRTASLA
jgi:DNA-binding CsgD family transcriptional regulator